ncbi:chemotaxis protein CheW [bacterium]|nr:chemotaxis protein CheW [bacterium]
MDNLENKLHLLQEVVQTHISYLGKRPSFEIIEPKTIVEFQIDAHFFCFIIDDIREIIRITAITEVPNAPEILEGVFNFRGELISLIDFRYILELEPKEYELDYNIIIFKVDHFQAGIIVDKVIEISQVQPEQIEPPVETPIQKSFVQGMVKKDEHIIMILNPRLLLSTKEQIEVNQILQADFPIKQETIEE